MKTTMLGVLALLTGLAGCDLGPAEPSPAIAAIAEDNTQQAVPEEEAVPGDEVAYGVFALEAEDGGFDEDSAEAVDDFFMEPEADELDEMEEFLADDDAEDAALGEVLDEDPDLAEGVKAARLLISWGQFPIDWDLGEITAWSGTVYGVGAKVFVRRALRYEPHDYYAPCVGHQCVMIFSHTMPHHDGLLLTVVAKPGAENPRVVINFPGLYKRVIPVPAIPAVSEVTTVDNLGNKVVLMGTTIKPMCEAGLAHGYWKRLNPKGGIFAGKWIAHDGASKGKLAGLWGTRNDGTRVLFGAYLSANGAFKGVLKGTYTPLPAALDKNGGIFKANWHDKDKAIGGILRGRYTVAPAGGKGAFLGRWAAKCGGQIPDLTPTEDADTTQTADEINMMTSACDFGDEIPAEPSPAIAEDNTQQAVPEEEAVPGDDELLPDNEVPQDNTSTTVEPVEDGPNQACFQAKKILHIKNRIDGRSQLEVKNFFAGYHHDDHAAPGLHRHDVNCQAESDVSATSAQVALAHDPTYINGNQWWPEWPENGENRDCHCDSSYFASKELLVPMTESKVTLNVIQARGKVSILEEPTAGNDYRLVIEWDDNPPDGCDFYEIEVMFEYIQCEEEPKFWCKEPGYCEYDCAFGHDFDCDNCTVDDGVCVGGCVPPDPDCEPYVPTWCEEQFDTETVCVMDQKKCLFYTVLKQSTCAEYCADRGGECVAAYHDLEDNCTKEGPSSCDEPAYDQLCECLRESEVETALFRVKAHWGQLSYAPEPGTMTPWDGFMAVDEGTFQSALPILFEHGGSYQYGGDDELFVPPGETSGIKWRSSTTVHYDGVNALVEVPTEGTLLTIATMQVELFVDLQQLDEYMVTYTVNALGDQFHLKIFRVVQ